MKPPRAARLPAFSCPWCGHLCDRATQWAGKFARPDPGDTTVCIECGCIGVFRRDLSVRRPTKREAREADNDPRVQNAVAAWAAMKASLGTTKQ